MTGPAGADSQPGKRDEPSGSRPYGQWPLDIWLAALIALAASRTAHVAPNLPEKIPVHFGFSGQPDGWAATGFWSLYGVLLIAAALWIGMSVAIWFINRVRDPKSIINMPGKERMSQKTAENVRAVTVRVMGVLELVTVVMMVHMQWLSLDVALSLRDGFGSGLMLFYIVLISLVSLYMIVRIVMVAGGKPSTPRPGPE